jgi:hypothetical protein
VIFAGTLASSEDDLASYDPNQTVLLIAVAGDDTYNSGSNNGTTTFEVTAISTEDDDTHGDVLGFTLQTNGLNNGSSTHGHDALLYFDYLFPFFGVQAENRSTPVIQPREAAAPRWPFVENPADGPVSAAYVGSFQSAASSFALARAYYTMQRINGGVFVLGGHTATGPTNTIGRTLP